MAVQNFYPVARSINRKLQRPTKLTLRRDLFKVGENFRHFHGVADSDLGALVCCYYPAKRLEPAESTNSRCKRTWKANKA